MTGVQTCALPIFGAQCRRDGVVEQRRLRAGQQVDVAEDAGGAELVLVLQVGAVAPLEQ